MFIALSLRFICVYPVSLLLCSRTERLYLWCTFHTYGITRLGNPEEHNPGFHHRAQSVISGLILRAIHSHLTHQKTLVMSFFFFLVGSCHRKKMLHSWYSAVTIKDGQNAHNARRKAGHCFCRTTCLVALILLSPRRQLRPPSFVNGCFIRLVRAWHLEWPGGDVILVPKLT